MTHKKHLTSITRWVGGKIKQQQRNALSPLPLTITINNLYMGELAAEIKVQLFERPQVMGGQWVKSVIGEQHKSAP